MIKVIGTIGPSSVDVDVLIKLKSIGLSSFRINLSHSSDELLEYYYKQFEMANIMPSLDTQGAQIRISRLVKNKFNHYGENITIGLLESHCCCDICINHKEFFDAIEIFDEVKIGFDGLMLK